MRPLFLDVIDATETELQVPEGCPEPGSRLTMNLDCTQGPCSGTLSRRKVVVARLTERGGSLVVRVNGEALAGPVSRLGLAIAKKDKVRFDPAEEPILLTYTVEQAGAQQLGGQLVLQPNIVDGFGFNGNLLRVGFAWRKGNRIALTLSPQQSGTIQLQREMTLNLGIEVQCREFGLGVPCKLRLTARPGPSP